MIFYQVTAFIILKKTFKKFGIFKNCVYICIMKISNRMTGKDYKKAIMDLRAKEKALDVRITERLLELSTIYPDAIISNVKEDGVKAKCLTPYYVSNLPIETRIEYIDKIETSMNKHEQMKLEIS